MLLLIPMISSDTTRSGSRARPAANRWRTRYVSAARTGNIAGICSVASLCAMKAVTSSNGMASSRTSRIGSGRKTRSVNRRQNCGRCWTSHRSLIAVYGPQFQRLYANRIALDYVGLTLEEWRQTRIAVHSFIQMTGHGKHDHADRDSAYALELRLREG